MKWSEYRRQFKGWLRGYGHKWRLTKRNSLLSCSQCDYYLLTGIIPGVRASLNTRSLGKHNIEEFRRKHMRCDERIVMMIHKV